MKINITIDAESIAELKSKVSDLYFELVDDIETYQLDLPRQPDEFERDYRTDTPPVSEETITKVAEIFAPEVFTPEPAPVEPVPVVEKAKRTRKVKEVVEAQEASVVNTVAPVVAPIQTTVVNFYSESEFIGGFAKVLNSLMANQIIDQPWLATKCAEYGVPFIFSLTNDRNKLIKLYADMVLEGKIVKKGDY